MARIQVLAVLLATVSWVAAHTVITYPGWRGDNLITNGTIGEDDYSDHAFPYGMQWMYPCGGLKTTTNRTYWHIDGGAIAIQPGWFQGHSSAHFHFNLGLGTTPRNYSLIMKPEFEIFGPRNEAYPGEGFCVPQVPLPNNVTVNEGDNATIQVIEKAKHGASLYTCVDITFTNDHKLIAPINETNCQNDSTITFGSIFSTASLASDAALSVRLPGATAIAAMTALLLGSAMWTIL